MRITIAAIGKAKKDAANELTHTFLKRLPWKVEIVQKEVAKSAELEPRKSAEAEWLLDATKKADQRFALDENGTLLTSKAFASSLQKTQQTTNHIAFIIGGADGLNDHALQQCSTKISFGRMTWPHLLIRPMLAEQIYRAYTIILNHPYHRE